MKSYMMPLSYLTLQRYNAVELLPIKTDESGDAMVCMDGQQDFYGVYLRYNPLVPANGGLWGVECIADISDKGIAFSYAEHVEDILHETIGPALIPMPWRKS